MIPEESDNALSHQPVSSCRSCELDRSPVVRAFVRVRTARDLRMSRHRAVASRLVVRQSLADDTVEEKAVTCGAL